MEEDEETVLVCWRDNKSSRFDGKTSYVSARCITHVNDEPVQSYVQLRVDANDRLRMVFSKLPRARVWYGIAVKEDDQVDAGEFTGKPSMYY